jgi:WD40 repeat protein
LGINFLIKIWDNEQDNDFSCNDIIQAHTQDIKIVKWCPNEDVLYSGSYDNTIKLWRYDESQEAWGNLNTLNSHNSTVWGLDISQDGKILVTCSDDKSIIVWYVKSYENIVKVSQLTG